MGRESQPHRATSLGGGGAGVVGKGLCLPLCVMLIKSLSLVEEKLLRDGVAPPAAFQTQAYSPKVLYNKMRKG